MLTFKLLWDVIIWSFSDLADNDGFFFLGSCFHFGGTHSAAVSWERKHSKWIFWDFAYVKMTLFYLIDSLATYRTLDCRSFSFRTFHGCLGFLSPFLLRCPQQDSCLDLSPVLSFLSENKRDPPFVRGVLKFQRNGAWLVEKYLYLLC